MSCFWTAVTTKVHALRHLSPSTVIAHLQALNRLTDDVAWQGEPLTENQKLENYTWVEEYDPADFRDGTSVPSCCPWLCLVCQLYRVSIDHVYNCGKHHKYDGQVISFRNVKGHADTVRFSSSTTHFA
jgi:hypothetical protein